MSKTLTADYIKEIEALFQKMQAGSNENIIVLVGDIDNQLTRKAAEKQYDLRNYKHNLDLYGVRHTFNRHGNEVSESKRGQIAITDSDIKRIPEIIYNYDKVEFSGKNKIGRETIIYTKQIEDGIIVYVEEIRSGRKRLTLNSMRKYKQGNHS
jgi:hypothetical protein